MQHLSWFTIVYCTHIYMRMYVGTVWSVAVRNVGGLGLQSLTIWRSVDSKNGKEFELACDAL